MNKQILAAICSVFLLMLFTAGAVYAYFNNIAVNANNIFSSGTLDLKLSKDNAQFEDTLSAVFGANDMSPGSCSTDSNLYFKNTGSMSGNHIDITVSNSDDAFAKFLRVSVLKIDGSDVSITDANGNGFPDMHDVSQKGINNLPITDHESHVMRFQTCLDATAGNEQQAKSNTATFSVTLDQGPHGQ